MKRIRFTEEQIIAVHAPRDKENHPASPKSESEHTAETRCADGRTRRDWGRTTIVLTKEGWRNRCRFVARVDGDGREISATHPQQRRMVAVRVAHSLRPTWARAVDG